MDGQATAAHRLRPRRAWTRMNESTGLRRDVTEKARPSHPSITFHHIVTHFVKNLTLCISFVKECIPYPFCFIRWSNVQYQLTPSMGV